MNKAELLKLGAFVKPEPVKRKIVWKDESGEEHNGEITILPRSVGSTFRGRDILKAGENREPHAVYIATYVRLGEEAEESFTYEDCLGMSEAFFEALVLALVEVHGKTKEAPKNSRPPKKSSASLSSQE